jgi:MarR family transcriptional regulator, organic hydroperoxide resistance regulator
MKTGSVPSAVLETMQALWGLAHALEARSKWMQKEFGVTGPQRLLVRVIGETPGHSAGEAARQLRLNPGTVSRLLRGLEQQRLVERKPDPNDGRRQRLILTARGTYVNSLKSGTVEAGVRRVIEETPTGEVQATVAFIRHLADVLAPGTPSRKKAGASRRPVGRR